MPSFSAAQHVGYAPKTGETLVIGADIVTNASTQTVCFLENGSRIELVAFSDEDALWKYYGETASTSELLCQNGTLFFERYEWMKQEAERFAERVSKRARQSVVLQEYLDKKQ